MDAGTLSCPQCGAPVPSGTAPATACGYCHARLATVACPSCFGLIFAGARHCSHCGTEVARSDVGSAETRRCPRCAVALEASAVGDAYLDECPGCAGVWLDVESFGRICASREQQAAIARLGVPQPVGDASHSETVRYIPCPACGRLMNRVNFAHCSGVIVDVCKGHGVWFDADELRRVVEFIRGGGMELARARELDALAEERRRIVQAQQSLAAQQSVNPRVGDDVPVGVRVAYEVLDWWLRT